jgi:hypothetical protein
MRPILACLLVALSACGSVAAPATASPPAPTPTTPAALLAAPLEACGTVKAWTPPTAAQPGSITVGSMTHSVNPGTNHGATGFVVKTGTDMCVFGGLDGQPTPYHGATVIDSPFCGAVLAFSAATPGAAGAVTLLHFAAVTLSIPAAVDLGVPRLGVRRCLAVGTTSAGEAVARGRAAPSILDMELGLWCGAVKSYATGSAIAIGSKRWEMTGGTAYDTGGPNGPDRTTAGKRMCLTAALDDQGRITRYLTSDMPPQEGGVVTSYAPSTAATPGTLVFSYKYVRTVAAGATLQELEVGKNACVTLGLDAAGDGVVTGSVACGGVGF